MLNSTLTRRTARVFVENNLLVHFLTPSASRNSFCSKAALGAAAANSPFVRVSIVEADRSEGTVWIRWLVAGFNDRFGDTSCIAATSMLQKQGFSA
ncbi:hypothetical protein [Sulfitobacter sp.]|uniref:hypothetical protein n=1 Tax=Sulfitobacter sp. TaxID=1903071 RepID=UPI0030010323